MFAINNSKKFRIENYTNIFKFNEYREPKNKDMAVILVYFNPANSVNIKNNILFVKDSFDKCKIPYYIGEIAFFDEKFLFENPESNIFQFRSNSIMFYKENLINIIESMIPSEYKKILILDADILFDNVIWYDIISNSLEHSDVCQPFHIAYYLDQNNIVINKVKSVVVDNIEGHPGFAWSFKREWLSKNKLFELSVFGGGDSVLNIMLSLKREYTGFYLLKNNILEYKKNISKFNKVSFCNISIYHLYHGEIKNRQYLSRTYIFDDIFKKYNISNMEDILQKDEKGLLVWKEKYRDELNNSMLDYFNNRNCDEYINKYF